MQQISAKARVVEKKGMAEPRSKTESRRKESDNPSAIRPSLRQSFRCKQAARGSGAGRCRWLGVDDAGELIDRIGAQPRRANRVRKDVHVHLVEAGTAVG